MTLKTLQKRFQSYLLNNNAEITSHIAATQNLSAQSRLKIYQNSYYERVINALSQDYPVLKATIGDNAFSSLITDYIKTHPSTDFNLRSIGKHLSAFILSKNLDFRMYADLAKLEYLLCEAAIDHEEKQFSTAYNILAVWKCFQESQTLVDFVLLPEEMLLKVSETHIKV